jgi:16S rRNA processing protein RimM
MDKDRTICVGMITGAHGVRGLLRLRSFTEDPETIMAYDELTDEDGKKSFAITIKSAAKDFFIAEMDGVKTKEAADALRNTKLYVSRKDLPKTGKREYYEADLIGLAVQDKKGGDHGKVLAIHNHGAGTFLEIGKGKSDSFMLPFTDAYVPEVDIKAGQVVVDVPEGWL